MIRGSDRHVQAHFSAEGAEHGWIVEGATITCALNQPYLIEIDLQHDRPDADATDLFGVAGLLRVSRVEHDSSYGGIISSVRTLGRGMTGHRTRVTLEPALASLRHGRDTRIFQDLTVPEVLAAVLGEALGPYGRSARQELTRAYPKREYTVQYQESHFDFAHRLMEEEGIVYYFAQDEDVETMVLIDAPASHPRIGQPFLQYTTVGGDAGLLEQEFVTELDQVQRIATTKVATRHFDWTHPSALIDGEAKSAAPGPEREVYAHDEQLTLHGFAGAYTASDVAEQVRVRQEMHRRPQLVYQGRSTVTELRTGQRFDLVGNPHGLDGSYVVIQMRHFLLGHASRSGARDSEQGMYLNQFTAITADTPWRPQRTRVRPRIRGIQTAIVTGPPGEEIHCDEHGRIKVHFHWDRIGGYDERSSCWIRVMQTAAGSGFGAWVLPRVGWEVVVAFVDGDPDRPIVTGCLYNGDQPLPYPLPEKKAMTLFKSNTYPGGGGYNELRLDDSKDAEEIWMHGQKDWNTVIENDLTRQVGHDETQHVGNNRTRTVGVDETLTVGANRTRLVGANETVTVTANRTRMVGANESVAISANQALSVGAARQTGIGSDDELQVAGDHSVGVAGSQSIQVGVNETYKVGKNADRKVGSSANEKVGKMRKRTVGLLEMVNVGIAQMVNVAAARIVTAGMVHMLNAGKLMKLNAGSKMELNCGGAKISLTSGGKITIQGATIDVIGSGDVNVKGAMIHLN
ncbi:MAG: type VI secretion system tip protein VgrG [Sandaracinaceae bacterium]|nr:type VI secretion system tip protein VgrG [Sandaracinaceae bacterium]